MRLSSITPVLALVLACNGGSSDTTTTDETDPTTSSSPTSDGPTTGPDTPTSGGGPDCGNGMIDADEDCDGADLAGKACADVDPAKPNGALVCAASCTYDASGCQAAGGAFIALNEVTSKGADAGPYAGLGDAVELFNPGGAAVDISGWKLSDDPGFPADKTYEFPSGTSLAPGAFHVVTAYDDLTMLGDFPFGLSSTNQETLTLADGSGAKIDQVIFPGALASVAYCRLPDGTGAWQQCDSTLGGANISATMVCGNGAVEGSEHCEGDDLAGATCQSLGFTGGTLACTASCAFETGQCTADTTVILNELESEVDQIEVYNYGDDPVDISGWILTDEAKDGTYDPAVDGDKLVFPNGSNLPAKTYLVVARGDLPGQHPFGLGGDGDTVTLFQGDLTVVDQVTYGPNLAAVSYCRIPDGPGNPWAADCIPTFGAANMKP